MAKENSVTIKTRFPLLFWFAMFFSFLLFPFLLLILGIDHIINLEVEKETLRTQKSMLQALDHLSENADPEQFFHNQLLKIFQSAEEAKNTFSILENNIKKLKNSFPQTLSFIVWNEKGELIDKLTDEKRFKYFIRKAYSLLESLNDHLQKFCPAKNSFLKQKGNDIRFLKSFLGRFLVAEHLSFPYLQDGFGRCLLTDIPGGKNLIWFRAGKKMTMLCFIQNREEHRFKVIKTAAAEANKKFKPLFLGAFDAADWSRCTMSLDDDMQKKLLVGLGKFENLHPAGLFEEKNLLMSFRSLNHRFRGFCFSNAERIEKIHNKKWHYIADLSAYALTFLFIFHCYLLKNPIEKVSIRVKTGALFVYSAVLPLLILSAISFDYLEQMQNHLINQKQNGSLQRLAEIDHSFNYYLENVQRRMGQTITEFNQQSQSGQSLVKLEKLLQVNFSPDSVLFLNDKGETIVQPKDSEFLKDTYAVKQFGAAVLRLINNRKADFIDDKSIFANTNLKHNLDIQNLGRINTFELLNKKFLYLCLPIKNIDQHGYRAILLVLWTQEALEKEYLTTVIKQNENNIHKLAYFLPQSFAYSSEEAAKNKVLRKLFYQAIDKKTINLPDLNYCGQEYIATARLGESIQSSVIAELIPGNLIKMELKTLTNKACLIIFIALLFALSLSHLISNQLLQPLHQLNEAIKQVKAGNFNHRTNIVTENELGNLGRSMNNAMENMKELEIARIVQESLLPENAYKLGNIEIFAQTISMTKLGGDYFDYFKLNDQTLGVFLGDAAGHGIPAALIMTMAKTVFSILTQKRVEGLVILEEIQKAIYSLRKHSVKSMMTAQLIEINTITGLGKILNCGHCYPVKYNFLNNCAEFQKVAGVPLGVLRKVNFKSLDFELNSGEIILLYSDGFLEGKNQAGEELGPERFLELVKAAKSDIPKVFAENLFLANKSWSKLQTDDLTVVIIKNTGEINEIG